MGLFSDEEEEEQQQEPQDPDPEHDAETGDERPQDEEASQETAEVETASGPETNGNGGSGADGNEELEKALKDLAARMTVIQSNVETVKDARGDLEDKLEEMESRMHRLGGLAEAVSSQYNPFLSENEPGGPSWQDETSPSEDADDHDEPLTPVAPEPDASPAGEGDDPPDAGGASPGAPEEPADHAPEATTTELEDERDLEAMERLLTDVRDVAETQERAERKPKDLKERLLLLEWVGLMMRRVGRAGLMDLMEYYEGLGWLDPPTKNKALRVAVGIDAPDRVGEGGWRGDLDLHERSLMAIQRLQGDDITQAELEALQMDMQRLFDR